ncbi:hypothetical protein PVAP13_6KG100935 [Panicum virgatum]|uniref:Uncharacterized protein n=1 Tax=Panicum virgatum TaxID=38727 RepID=A0A8T0R940_PANVG|nr:hypothetical protein PVAP13_6KG100935 [Panicum virgatum]
MVPHSRRGRAWRNLFKTSGRAPVHFLQPPSLGFVPLSTSILPLASPGDSSSQSLASHCHGAQLNPRRNTPRRVRGGGSLVRGIAGSGQARAIRGIHLCGSIRAWGEWKSQTAG